MKRCPNRLALAVFTCLYVLALHAHAQTNTEGVGVGVSVLDDHAALHIEAPNANKGMLLPRWAALANGHVAEDERLLAYHSGKNRFIFFGQNGGLKWMYVNPWLTSDVRLDGATFASTPVKIAVNSTSAPTESIEVDGIVSAYYDPSESTTNSNIMEGHGMLPIGGIIVWTKADPWPNNFVLCNGQTSHGRTTPNLVDRFIVGGQNNIGTKGGSHSKTTSTVKYESGGSTQSRITSTENRPVHYQVAYIMRVY